jgi:hypothetical protein
MKQRYCDNPTNHCTLTAVTNACNKNKINTKISLFDWLFIIMDFLFINDVNSNRDNMVENLPLER